MKKIASKYNLIFDCGGTKIKAYLYLGKKLVLKKTHMGSNAKHNLSKTIELINSFIAEFDSFDIDKFYCFIAGYKSTSASDKELLFSKLILKPDYINTDAFAPGFIYGAKTATISLGTGTVIAFFDKENKNGKIFWGLGHTKYEPCSGSGIVNEFLNTINESSIYIELFNLKNKEAFDQYLLTNDKKNVISTACEKLLSMPKYEKIVNEIFNKQMNDLLKDEILVKLNEVETIILNGSIWKQKNFVEVLKSKLSNKANIIIF